MEPTVEVQFQIELLNNLLMNDDLSITAILVAIVVKNAKILVLNVHWVSLSI